METCARSGRFVGWMATSAKSGENVKGAMDALLVAMRQREGRHAHDRGREHGRGQERGRRRGGPEGKRGKQPQRRRGSRGQQQRQQRAFPPKTPTFTLSGKALERPKKKGGKCC